jgi:hypothetical protein
MFCGEDIQPKKYSIVEIKSGAVAELLGFDIGNAKSMDVRLHPDCAQVVKVTIRIHSEQIGFTLF